MRGWDSRPEWFLCCSIKNQLLIQGVTYVLCNNEPHSIKSAISKTSDCYGVPEFISTTWHTLLAIPSDQE